MCLMRNFAFAVLLISGIAEASLFNDARDFFNSKGEGMGVASLKLGVGALNASLGSGVMARNATLLFYNPSQLPLISGFNASFSHSSHILGMRYEFFGLVWGDGEEGYGLGANYFSAGDIELRDERQTLYGEYSPFSLVSCFSYARRTGEMWLGGSLKYIYERYYIYSISGYAVDIGFSYSPMDNLIVASCVSNIGPTIAFGVHDAEDIRLPLAFDLAAGYTITKFAFSLSAKKSLDEKLITGFGAQYKVNPYIILRMGNRFGHDSTGPSFGFGLKYLDVLIDYAYLPYGLGLGSSHHITLTLE